MSCGEGDMLLEGRHEVHSPNRIAREIEMTLEQLRIFVAVAERQHVTHAAEALNLAQSAASHAIASLEDRHKTKLFNRIGRHIELTDAGQAFLKEARAVLAAAEAAELALIEFSENAVCFRFKRATQLRITGCPGIWRRFGAPTRRSRYERVSATPSK